MAHLTGLRRSQGGTRAWVGIAAGIVLIAAATIEGAHTHTGSEMAPACSVCSIAHQGVPTSAADAPVIAGPEILQPLPLSGNRLVPGIVHLSPHRSRAPPPPISL